MKNCFATNHFYFKKNIMIFVCIFFFSFYQGTWTESIFLFQKEMNLHVKNKRLMMYKKTRLFSIRINNIKRDTISFLSSKNLLAAIEENNIECVKLHLENGYSVDTSDTYGNTCFLLACEHGHLELVKYFLVNGSSVDEINLNYETGLFLASAEGHLDLVKFLF